MGTDGVNGVDFNAISRGDIQATVLTSPSTTTGGVTDYNITRSVGGVFVYETLDGRFGKLRINNFSWWAGGQTIHGIYIPDCTTGGVDYKFVTFDPGP